MKTIQYYVRDEGWHDAQVNVQMTFAEAYKRGGCDGWNDRFCVSPKGEMVRIYLIEGINGFIYRASDGINYEATGDEPVYVRLETVGEMRKRYDMKIAKHAAILDQYAIKG